MASAILVSCFNISICCLQYQYQLQHFIFQLSILVKLQYFFVSCTKTVSISIFPNKILIIGITFNIVWLCKKKNIFFCNISKKVCNVCFYSNMILVRNSSPAQHATRYLNHQMVCFIIKELIMERDHSAA